MSAPLIDVDGHVLEPADLWTRNIAPDYRSRALRIDIDDEGLEYWSFDGVMTGTYSKGRSANVAAIGTTREWRKEHVFEKRDITWEQSLARVPGAWNPDERVKMMTAEGIDISILYPTVGLAFARLQDADLSNAYCTVYNDWIVDFCSAHPDRLVPALTLPWHDVDLSVSEMKRFSELGEEGHPGPLRPAQRHLLGFLPLGPHLGRAPGPGRPRNPPRRLRRHLRILHPPPGGQTPVLVDLHRGVHRAHAQLLQLLPGLRLRQVPDG